MLYKLSSTEGRFNGLEAMPFKAFSDCGQVEKDLENLLAENLLEVLFDEIWMGACCDTCQRRKYCADPIA